MTDKKETESSNQEVLGDDGMTGEQKYEYRRFIDSYCRESHRFEPTPEMMERARKLVLSSTKN